MMTGRVCKVVCAAAVCGLSVGEARAVNGFLSAVSSVTITHTPSITNLSLQDADLTPTFPSTTLISSVTSTNNPGTDHSSTFIAGASRSDGLGGAAQFNTFPSTSGYANVAFAALSGVSQTDGSNIFGSGTSKLVMSVDLSWDISAGWSGPRTAYELMTVSLMTAGAGDLASAIGDFTFHVDLNAVGSPGDDITKSVHIGQTVVNGADLKTTLFGSTLLTTAPITAAAAGEKHIFRITGSWTFLARDPSGQASVELPSLDVQSDFLARLDTLNSIDPMILQLLDGSQQFAQGGGTFEGVLSNVPEPGSAAVLLLTLGGAAMRRGKGRGHSRRA
ncbi:MAG: PEP-CTERM sorting domain-containing protein [Planctomycetes bacterium]|nr:PEP-CTERM sorting domain-containing protein [Planctomycetota bacterium]